jgi:transcriptional regulator of arginine metabolism
MNRHARQQAILQLVREQELSTQTQVADALHAAGFEAVQTTVSRDIAELGLVKVRAESGKLVYAPPGTADPDRLARMVAELRRDALVIESSGNIVLITTPAGFAAPLAQVIDEAAHPRILGTIAGDNTIMLLAREGISGTNLRDELRGLLLEGAA